MKTLRPKNSKVQAPLNIFLVGDLGAGKATQSAFLKKSMRLYEIDMGVEQEIQRRQDPKLDAIFRKFVDAGKMNPTRIYRTLVKNAIGRVPSGQGILFDGHPKMPDEVKFVSRTLKKAGRSRIVCIYLSVPWKETVRRNLQRKGYFGDKKRADDSLEALKIRRNFAQANIKKSEPLYRSMYPFRKVSGMGTIAEVRERVVRALQQLSKELDE